MEYNCITRLPHMLGFTQGNIVLTVSLHTGSLNYIQLLTLDEVSEHTYYPHIQLALIPLTYFLEGPLKDLLTTSV